VSIIIVVDNPKKIKINLPGIEIISAKSYIANNSPLTSIQSLKVFNLCKSYRYQSTGYYISLLAAARGHKAIPTISTIEETKHPSVVRSISWELENMIQQNFKKLLETRISLNIYFGNTPQEKYNKIAMEIFNLFEAPLIRVNFLYRENKWRIQNIQMLALNDVPDKDIPYLEKYATNYFASKTIRRKKQKKYSYDLAILVNENEKNPPSDPIAIKKFIRAGEKAGFSVDVISKNNFHNLPEYDALFIRETTSVNHHTFRFAQKAKAEDMVVIDDPESIIKCTNKVYLAELLKHNNINTPQTIVLNKDNYKEAIHQLAWPVILKKPDSSFSQGVTKADNEISYLEKIKKLFETSDLIIAQEFMPTSFDWRVGIFDKKPLYVCKYFMVGEHWQVLEWADSGAFREGKWQTLAVENAPPQLIKFAMKATNLIGKGLYGIDIKEINNKYYVIEINDNPSIERGVEDAVLKDKLYLDIMQTIYQRVANLKAVR
jgi:glutathione synthase/RimK-type ligase-like ATP-grasp enzyme